MAGLSYRLSFCQATSAKVISRRLGCGLNEASQRQQFVQLFGPG